MPKEKPTGIIVYILVDNIDETLEKAVKLGGKIVTPKTREGENYMATIADRMETFSGYTNTAKELITAKMQFKTKNLERGISNLRAGKMVLPKTRGSAFVSRTGNRITFQNL